ncbi:MAG: PD40 domain-containing protein [Bacteroidia bacterium]|nr:PD40 domain-containing protein [Bacteroidia bacterium]
MKRFTFFFTALILCACGNQPASDSSPVQIDLSLAPDSVELFAPGVVSTSLNERDMAISPDGKEIVFTLNNHNNTLRVLVGLQRGDQGWSKPEIMPFSGEFQDIEPFFAPDNSKLFFASNRPLDTVKARPDYNIWMVSRKEGGWEEPVSVGENINTAAHEFYPAVAANGNLYFTAQYGASEDIHLSKFENGVYLPPVPLDSNVNSPTYEFNAWVSPTENQIIFSSYGRDDDLGGGDLYISEKDENGNWLPARHLGEGINSDALDYCPFADLENRIFYFTSNRTQGKQKKLGSLKELEDQLNGPFNGMGNVFRVSMKGFDRKL